MPGEQAVHSLANARNAMTRTTAAAVANAFLDIQNADRSEFPRIDPMKLQKLLYYSHAWWLAMKGEPLFDEEIYAWPWGPVVPHIYGEFKHCGRSEIGNDRATEVVKVGPGYLDYRRQAPAPVPEDVMNFLRGVWETHKPFTGVRLSNATHEPGEPWTIVKNQYGSLESKPVIPNDLIRGVFLAKLGNQNGQNTSSS